MSSKIQSVYSCQECGAQFSKWMGKCLECAAWNSLIEEVMSDSSGSFRNKKNSLSNIAEVYDLCGGLEEDVVVNIRYDLGISEFNRVLGGGLVAGSAVLLCGEPGIGKSTLLMQLCHSSALAGISCAYVSGEESAAQIKLRAKRLGVVESCIKLVVTTELSQVVNFLHSVECKAKIIVIDSIQTLYSNEINSSPGTVSQVKACAFELISIAKQLSIALLLVGHVTKDGQVAGPKTLEHMVDTVLYFEGEGAKQYRIVRAVKNRFGSTNEIGVFDMANDGLREVTNPSKLFMSERKEDISGSCIFAGIEGTRSLLIEVQALVVRSFMPVPKRAAIGWDSNRLSMMVAILNSSLGMSMMDKEVYLNIAGGLKIEEPAADLAVAISLISAMYNVNIPRDTVFFGELGLSGELRQVIQVENRINEAIKLGFERVVMPYDDREYGKGRIEVCRWKTMKDILDFFPELRSKRKNRRSTDFEEN
jgi:DNA repair protein RadA/Sms